MNQYVDFTNLKPFASKKDILEGLDIAKKNQYYGFCFPSCYLKQINYKRTVKNEHPIVKLITVVGFPLGYSSIEEKVQAIESFSASPPDEIDFVINLSAVKSGNWKYLNDELHAIKQALLKVKIPIFNNLQDKEPAFFEFPLLKAIIESPHWDSETLEKICFLCIANGIDFIKTSTGFLEEGITMEKKFESIELIKKCIQGTTTQIKLSGGVKSREIAQKAIALGVKRIGTSSIL